MMCRCLLAAVLAWPGTSAPAALKVGDLALEYGDPWQRGDEREEQDSDSIILRLAGDAAGVQVILPRHQARLRMSEEIFFKQLEFLWRAQYGGKLELGWLDAGGRQWRVARRPSLDRSDFAVFHLVAVIEGRAHHLLAYVPAEVAVLPDAVRALLDGQAATALVQGTPPPRPTEPPQPTEMPAPVRLTLDESLPKRADETPSTPPLAPPGKAAQQAVPPAATPATHPLPVVLRQARAVEAERWALREVVKVMPKGRALEALVAQEAQLIKGLGAITGYELRPREHGMAGFLDGYLWAPGPQGRDLKQPFMRRWDLSWTPPPQVWKGGQPLSLKVDFGARGPDQQAQPGVRFELTLLCGRERELRDAVARLGEGGAAAPTGTPALGCRAPAGRPEGPQPTLPHGEVHDAAAPGAATGPGEVTLDLPMWLPGPMHARNVKEKRLLVLTVRPLVSKSAPHLGDGLLGGSSVHYLYVPMDRP